MSVPEPMSDAEVRELLTSTLHGELPWPTVQRMMATLAVWLDERGGPLRLRRARMGFGVEGVALERSPDGKRITKMQLRTVALTPSPSNPDCVVDEAKDFVRPEYVTQEPSKWRPRGQS